MEQQKITDIAARNTNVDPEKLRRNMEAAKELEARGLLNSPGYRITSPFARPAQRTASADTEAGQQQNCVRR